MRAQSLLVLNLGIVTEAKSHCGLSSQLFTVYKYYSLGYGRNDCILTKTICQIFLFSGLKLQ